MPIYTIRDRDTGQSVKFNWDKATLPTDSDMQEIFETQSQVQLQQPQQQPQDERAIIDSIKQRTTSTPQATPQAAPQAPVGASDERSFIDNVIASTKQLGRATGEMAKGLTPSLKPTERTEVNLPIVGKKKLPLIRPQLLKTLKTRDVLETPGKLAVKAAEKGITGLTEAATRTGEELLKNLIGQDNFQELDQSVKYHMVRELPKAIEGTAIDLVAPLLSPTNLVLGAIIGRVIGAAGKGVKALEVLTGLKKVVSSKIPSKTYTLRPEQVRNIFNTIEGDKQAAALLNQIPNKNAVIKKILSDKTPIEITIPESITKRVSYNQTYKKIKDILGAKSEPIVTRETIGGVKIAGKEIPKVVKAVIPKQVIPKEPLQLSKLEPKERGLIDTIKGRTTSQVHTPAIAATKVLEKPQVATSKVPQNKLSLPDDSFTYGAKKIARKTIDNEALTKYGEEGKEIFKRIKQGEHEATKDMSADIVKMDDALVGLSETDYKHFADYVEGKKAIPEHMIKAVKTWNGISKHIANKAKKYNLQIKLPTGQKIPFAAKEKYYPAFVKEDKLKEILASQDKYSAFIQKVAEKNNMPVSKAHSLIQRMVSDRANIYGHLEKARLAKLPEEFYERDPRKILANYISKSYNRLGEAKFLGGQDEVLEGLVEKALEKGEDFEEIQLLSNRILGREKFDKNIEKVSRYARSYNNYTKLSLAAFTNLGDIMKPLIRTNLSSTIEGIAQSFTKEGKHHAAISGVLKTKLQEYAKEHGFSQKFFEYSGFQKVERGLRTVTANAAKNYVDILYSKLKANPVNKFARRRLEQFGLDPDTLLAQKKLKKSDYLDASIQAIADTQPISKTDIPFYWQSPTGKIITQYKTFAYKQYKFTKKFMFDELKAGNPKPIITFLIAGAAVGEGVADLKAFVRGRDRDDKFARRIIDNYMTIGGLGLATDFLANLQYGTFGGGLLKFVSGPTLSDMDAWVTAISGDLSTLSRTDKKFAAIGGLSKKNQRQMKTLKKSLYSVPFAGAYLSSKAFPRRGAYRARTIPIAEEILQLFGDTGKNKKKSKRSLRSF